MADGPGIPEDEVVEVFADSPQATPMPRTFGPPEPFPTPIPPPTPTPNS